MIISLKNVSGHKRHQILDELKPVATTMPEYFVIGLVDKMKPAMNDDETLLAKLEAMLRSSKFFNSLNSLNSYPIEDVMRRTPTPVSAPTPTNDGENSWIWWLVGIVFFFFCLSQCS